MTHTRHSEMSVCEVIFAFANSLQVIQFVLFDQNLELTLE